MNINSFDAFTLALTLGAVLNQELQQRAFQLMMRRVLSAVDSDPSAAALRTPGDREGGQML